MRKLTEAQSKKAWELYEFYGVDKTALCRRYQVSQPTMDRIIREEKDKVMAQGGNRA